MSTVLTLAASLALLLEGILEGKEIWAAEARLKAWMMRDNSSESTVEFSISNRVQERINKLIAVALIDEGFTVLRTK